MQSINHFPPERMTPEQRRAEVAALLATGLCRLRASTPLPTANVPTQRAVQLAFTGNQSVHVHSLNKRTKEST